MARWQPHAPERLVAAALELFEEQGYESTTVIEIAERAGLTKSSFFRHFPDKREVLFGGDALAGLLAEGIAAAPPEAGPLEALAHALDALGRTVFTPERREFAARRGAVIAAHPELREREALKGLGLSMVMIEALGRRGVPDLAARVAAELGALAWTIAFERWCGVASAAGSGGASGAGRGGNFGAGSDGNSVGGSDGDFGEAVRRALDEVRVAGGQCLRG